MRTTWKRFASLQKNGLKGGEHELAFRAAVQFGTLCWHFRFCMDKVEMRFDDTEMLQMEPTPLLYSRQNCGCLQDPRLKRLQNTNQMGQASYFWCKILKFNMMLTRLCNNVPDKKKLSHPGRTNQMSIASCLWKVAQNLLASSSLFSSKYCIVWIRRKCSA